MRIKPTEASWMAGLFDGEGSVVYRATSSKTLALRLRIGMTHIETILRYSDLLTQQGIKSSWYEQPLPSGKTIFTVEVATREEISKVCDLLLPYSITKRNDLEAAQAALVLIAEGGNFIAGRPDRERLAVHAKALSLLETNIGKRYQPRKGN